MRALEIVSRYHMRVIYHLNPSNCKFIQFSLVYKSFIIVYIVTIDITTSIIWHPSHSSLFIIYIQSLSLSLSSQASFDIHLLHYIVYICMQLNITITTHNTHNNITTEHLHLYIHTPRDERCEWGRFCAFHTDVLGAPTLLCGRRGPYSRN